MALVGDALYVANTDALLRFPYRSGETRITAPGTKVTDLPGGPINHHWTKNVIASADGTKLYVAVGSNSNVAENGLEAERERAAVWEVDAQTGQHRLYATGTRNPVGLAWEPQLRRALDRGERARRTRQRPGAGLHDRAARTAPSTAGRSAITASTSTAGRRPIRRWWPRPSRPTTRSARTPPRWAWPSRPAEGGLPAPYREGAFVGQHGSWNRKPPSGYKVIFVPFAGGQAERHAGRRARPASSMPTARRRAGRSASRRTATAGCWWRTMSATRSGG